MSLAQMLILLGGGALICAVAGFTFLLAMFWFLYIVHYFPLNFLYAALNPFMFIVEVFVDV